jgi:hypothetical protein
VFAAAFVLFHSEVAGQCHTEHYPVVYDGLGGVNTGWTAALLEDHDHDSLYLGGYADAQPMLGKFETNNLRYTWLYGLQMEDDSAVQVKNLATSTENSILAALVEIDVDHGFSMYFLEKATGVPVVPAQKISNPTNPTLRFKAQHE